MEQGKKISGKHQVDIFEVQSGFVHGQSGSFFLQGTFRRFPGAAAKHGIFTDQVKKISKRTISFFLADNRCGAFDIKRL